MSADCFTWHPDQDDVYDGNKCGTMTVNGPPSAFRKDQPYGFTMRGDLEDTLTLRATPTAGDEATFWAYPSGSSVGLIKFNIESGTFAYKSPKGAVFIGNDDGNITPNVVFTVTGRCILEAFEIYGLNLGTEYPCTKIDIHGNGAFSAAGNSFDGEFIVNITDTGAMKVSSNRITLSSSSFNAYGMAPDGGYSLDLNASAAQPGESKISLSSAPITCKSSAKARLRSKSLTLGDTNIRAELGAAIEVACDAFTVTGSSSFILSHGTATFTFSSENGEQKLPVDYRNKQYPKGMFNCIANEGDNTGSFLFRAKDAAEARQLWLSFLGEGYFAIDGTIYSSAPINGYKLTDYGYTGTYLSVGIVKV